MSKCATHSHISNAGIVKLRTEILYPCYCHRVQSALNHLFFFFVSTDFCRFVKQVVLLISPIYARWDNNLPQHPRYVPTTYSTILLQWSW